MGDVQPLRPQTAIEKLRVDFAVAMKAALGGGASVKDVEDVLFEMYSSARQIGGHRG
jgi:hypothetical protein